MADLVIIGAGIMGLSTAWAARRNGLSVTVIDQGPIPNPASSSFDSHRLIRYPYGALQGYRKMVSAAYDAWALLWGDLDHTHYIETGTLVVGPADHGWSGASWRDLTEAEMGIRPVDTLVVRSLVPGYIPPPGASAGLLASGGILFADRIVTGLAGWLAESGAHLIDHSRVISFGEQVVILEDGRRIGAKRVVACTGAWSENASVVASRQAVAYVTLLPADVRIWERVPMVLDLADPGGFYLVPPVGGTPLKIGDHAFTRQGSPDDLRSATESERNSLRALIQSRIPFLASAGELSFGICYYSVAPDERFLASVEGSTWRLCGFSGHGFKFGPLIGLRLLDVIQNRTPPAAFQTWMAGRA